MGKKKNIKFQSHLAAKWSICKIRLSCQNKWIEFAIFFPIKTKTIGYKDVFDKTAHISTSMLDLLKTPISCLFSDEKMRAVVPFVPKKRGTVNIKFWHNLTLKCLICNLKFSFLGSSSQGILWLKWFLINVANASNILSRTNWSIQHETRKNKN